MEGNFNDVTNNLRQVIEVAINELDDYITTAELLSLTNEQWFINCMDRLNELSVKH